MKAFKERIYSVANNFFLRKHTPLPSTMQLLKSVYPTVDWTRVDFYEGLPWFTPLVAPYAGAQALPQFYSFGRFRIYLQKYDESSIQCLADIIHEGMHILQAMNYWRGYGLGFLRGFIVYYGAFFAKYGYRNNHFEIPAYNQEFRFLELYKNKKGSGLLSDIDRSVIENIQNESSLVSVKSIVPFNENYFLLIASFIITLLIAVIKPLADILIFILRPLVIRSKAFHPNSF